MRREILALLLMSVVVNAALDQSYVHTIERDGSSTITKTMDLSIFSALVSPGSFERMEEICRSHEMTCSVENKTVSITERFSPGNYYSFSADYGIPFVTYRAEVKKVPTDRFGESLEELLLMADAMNTSGEQTEVLDLSETERNRESAFFMRSIGIEMEYRVEMPANIEEAAAGDVEAQVTGNSAAFDLVDVIDESESMVVVSREINFTYLLVIGFAIILGALTLSFFKPKKRKKK